MAAPRTERQKSVRRHLLIYGGLTPYLFIAVFPIYWMLITAFKQEPDLYRMDNIPFWFNLPPTLKNFDILFYQTNYGSWIINTMNISLCVAIITLLTAVPAGYALARLRLPGAENMGIAIFLTYLVPAIILFLPLSRVVATLGLQDSWWSLVLVYPTFTVPFCTWLMMGFFKTVPMEMEEAARVDGCGQLGALLRVVLPVSLPGILTSVIFAFTLSMQDFLYGLAFVSPGDQKPVPVGVPTELIRGDVYFWGSLGGVVK
jgi:multiple sugar transport system permease protein